MNTNTGGGKYDAGQQIEMYDGPWDWVDSMKGYALYAALFIALVFVIAMAAGFYLTR